MATTKTKGTKTIGVPTQTSKKTSTKEATKNSIKVEAPKAEVKTKKVIDAPKKSSGKAKEEIKAETKKVIKKEALATRKYKGIDYDDPNVTDKMKKDHRSKIRTKLHRFVSDYTIAKKTGKNLKEKTMPIFKGFRSFFVAEFNLKLENCELAFKGSEAERLEDFTQFIKEFKGYLKDRKAAKLATA